VYFVKTKSQRCGVSRKPKPGKSAPANSQGCYEPWKICISFSSWGPEAQHDDELHFPKSEVKMTILCEKILLGEANPGKTTMILDMSTLVARSPHGRNFESGCLMGMPMAWDNQIHNFPKLSVCPLSHVGACTLYPVTQKSARYLKQVWRNVTFPRCPQIAKTKFPNRDCLRSL
jgi:hypothetical protein